LFGLEIQKLVLKKDLKGISELIDDERNPLKKETLLSRDFDEHFNQKWIDLVTGDPPCRPIGWRGFNLGHGSVWYDKISTNPDLKRDLNNKNDKLEWQITHINYPEELLPLSEFPEGWTYNNKTLHPLCFATGFKDATTSISLNSCLSKKTKLLSIDDGNVSARNREREDISYSILKEINVADCELLAQNIDGRCLQSYLLRSHYWGGGSMSTSTSTVYGLFELKNGEKYIFPLKVVEH